MISIDHDFEALKLLSRMKWMLNFEALASVANDEDAIDSRVQRPLYAS